MQSAFLLVGRGLGVRFICGAPPGWKPDIDQIVLLEKEREDVGVRVEQKEKDRRSSRRFRRLGLVFA